MKTRKSQIILLLVSIVGALAVLAESVPPFLRDKQNISVYGTVTLSRDDTITVSNYVMVPEYSSPRMNASGGVIPGQPTGRTYPSPIYYYVKHYPGWQRVRKGDEMKLEKGCYLISANGPVRIVYYWKAQTNAAPGRVWQ